MKRVYSISMIILPLLVGILAAISFADKIRTGGNASDTIIAFLSMIAGFCCGIWNIVDVKKARKGRIELTKAYLISMLILMLLIGVLSAFVFVLQLCTDNDTGLILIACLMSVVGFYCSVRIIRELRENYL